MLDRSVWEGNDGEELLRKTWRELDVGTSVGLSEPAPPTPRCRSMNSEFSLKQTKKKPAEGFRI